MEPLRTFDSSALSLTLDQMKALIPYVWVFGGACVALVTSLVRGWNPKWSVGLIVVLFYFLGIVSSVPFLGAEPVSLFSGMMVSDSFGNFFNVIFLVSAIVTVMLSFRYLDKEQLQYGEYYLLVIFSAVGMMLMASSLHLIVIFIALEIMSLCIYVLVGFRRSDRRSNEAAMKYFILGSAASAVMLYGSSLLYGATGSLSLTDILAFTQDTPKGMTPVFHLGAWMVITGFLFKVASVPFHMWMPDVYEGAPAPVTAFMTTGVKAASFATLVRVFIGTGYSSNLTQALSGHLHDILWVSAVLTMLIGNVIALTQTNLKRMLAYSSIAHTGYLLMGVIAADRSEMGFSPIVMYLVSYVIMNLGAFGILSVISGRGDTGLTLQDLSGMGRRRPWLAFGMAIFLFSMAGIPPTAGFVAKYYLFYAAVQAGEIWLVILGVLCSAISVYFYLRVIVYMFMRDPVGLETPAENSPWAAVAIAAAAILTLQIGILPSNLFTVSKQAVAAFPKKESAEKTAALPQ